MTASPATISERIASSRNTSNSVDLSRNEVSSHPTQQPMKQLRKWRVFPGRNKFHCNGRIMMAKQTGILHFTISLIVITVALFFGFECRLTLVTEIPNGLIIPIVCSLLFLFNMSCLLRTAWSDPGIIPRATPEEALYAEQCIQEMQTEQDNGNGENKTFPRTLDVAINGIPFKLKYCFTCKLYRPPRASHCSLCDNCVDNFDHHCPWVGNCVGRRNYRYFYLFITSLTFLCLYIFSFSIIHMVILSKRQGGFIEALKISPGSILEVFVCFFSVWSIVGLSGFHSYLILQSLTTNEDIKGTWSKKKNKDNFNPFGHSNPISNCCYILCSPLPPSLIDRRGFVPEKNTDFETGLKPCNSKHNNTVLTPASSSMVRQVHNEASDTADHVSYPEQPSHNSTSNVQQNVTCMDEISLNDEEPSVKITHHALPIESLVRNDFDFPQAQMNDKPENLVDVHQHRAHISSSYPSTDDESQPDVIIEYLPPHCANVSIISSNVLEAGSNDPNTSTNAVVSTDCRTLLHNTRNMQQFESNAKDSET